MNITKNRSFFRRIFVLIVAVALLFSSLYTSKVWAAEARTTIYVSDDTGDYVTGSRSKTFTVGGSTSQTVTFSVAYFFEDRDHSQGGLLKFTNLTKSGNDATVELANMVTSGRTYVNLLAGCTYRVTLSARCGGYYMATYNVYR